MSYLPEKTIRYKTYVKTALVESLKPVFLQHIDEKLRDTKVVIDLPRERQAFPSVVVRFYENEIFNAGVGHEEKIDNTSSQTVTLINTTGGTFNLTINDEKTAEIAYNATSANVKSAIVGLASISSGDVQVTGSAGGPYTIVFNNYINNQIKKIETNYGNLVGANAKVLISNSVYKFKHYFYRGDIELAIYALSSLDRDLISDTLVQTIAMGDLADYTNNFFNRIYPASAEEVPDSIGHFININSDKIAGINETQTAVPWDSENDLMYTSSYRVNVWGEFYSLPPDAPYQYVANVFLYPYIEGVDSIPTGLTNGSEWQPS